VTFGGGSLTLTCDPADVGMAVFDGIPTTTDIVFAMCDTNMQSTSILSEQSRSAAPAHRRRGWEPTSNRASGDLGCLQASEPQLKNVGGTTPKHIESHGARLRRQTPPCPMFTRCECFESRQWLTVRATNLGNAENHIELFEHHRD